LSRLRRCRAYIFALLSVLLIAALEYKSGRAEDVSSAKFAYESEVEYCRKTEAKPIALSDDKRFLCFDGWITPDLDLSLTDGLEQAGLFIVRSFGGSVEKAVTLANLLHDKHARIIVYDYCNSACANYLFIASELTFVRRHSIVVWHNGDSGLRDCFQFETSGGNGPPSLKKSPCPDVPIEAKARHWQVEALSDKFLKERTIASGFDPPESFYVRKILKNLLDATGVFPDVGWMWNPRYYRNVLKTKVSYEAYPESQDEVDEIVARFHFRRVIYDP
jgi:hypothetical protein